MSSNAGFAIVDVPSAISEPRAPIETPKRERGQRSLRRLLVLTDVFAVALAFSGAVRPWESLAALKAALVATAATLVALRTMRLYQARVSSVRSVENARLLQGAFVGCVAGVAGSAYWRSVPDSRFAIGAAFAAALLWCGRAGYRTYLRSARRQHQYLRPVLLLGTNEEACEFAHLIGENPEFGYCVSGVLGDAKEYAQFAFGAPLLGTLAELPDVLESTGVTGAIIASTALDPRELNEASRTLQVHGAHCQISMGLRHVGRRRLRMQLIGHEPVLYLEPSASPQWQLWLKRPVDIALSAAVLVLVGPVMLLVALLVKLGDRGPILFKQLRVGRNGQTFMMYKFRTMVVDAEQRLHEVAGLNQRRGPLFKLAADPRVTRIGRVLRASSLDELPQIFNVLRGDMSLVGPRPALPKEVSDFDPELRQRLNVLPGITGLWQVEARDHASFDNYRRLDLFYVENWTLALDAVILLKTIGSVAGRAVRLARSVFHLDSKPVSNALD